MKNHTKHLLLVATAALMFQCKKAPEVTTVEVKDITRNSAKIEGRVSEDGKGPITSRGICYSTMPEPNIHNERASSGSGPGRFQVNLQLDPQTTYYVRAYATTPKGTFYGEEKSFTTLTFLSFTHNGKTIEVHPNDNAVFTSWSVTDTVFTDAGSIDDGMANTNKIAAFAMGSAAKICQDLVAGGKDDWYLPSANELNAMQSHSDDLGLSANYYWSSTENDTMTAVAQRMSDGMQQIFQKTDNNSCRCIRKN